MRFTETRRSPMNAKVRLIFISTIPFVLGVALGGYLNSVSKPRSVLALKNCDNCWHPNEITGIITSVAIQKFPDWVPSVVLETETVIAIRHPAPAARHHYVVFPKRDIKNLSDLELKDRDQVADLHLTIRDLIVKNKLKNYRVWSNGQGIQIIGYLHFHLAGS